MTMMHAGNLQVSTPSDRDVAIVRVFDAPRTLVFDCMSQPQFLKRWLLGPPGWAMTACEAVNTSAFTESGGRTTFTLTIRYASPAARDAAVTSGMTRGIDHSYNLLADLMAALPAKEGS